VIEAPSPEGDEPSPPVPASLTRRVAAVFYLLLFSAAAVWSHVRTGDWLPRSLDSGDLGRSVALGAAAAAAVLALSTLLLRGVPAVRFLAEEFRRMLGRVDVRTAAVLALTSGIAEEVFFRGVMQPAFGLVPTSLLFGLVHTGPDRRYVAWMVFAVAMGFTFGWILEVTRSLAGPVLAHVSINFVNLLRIGRLEVGGPS
jgi:membrane protease YdiL (CAAX protease family)